jgi:hypothetical protein
MLNDFSSGEATSGNKMFPKHYIQTKARDIRGTEDVIKFAQE